MKAPKTNNESKQNRAPSQECRLQRRLVRARQSANRKMLTYIAAMEAAENEARSSDARWNEKWADYWKGRRDGLRTALEIIGPNVLLSDAGGENLSTKPKTP